MLDVVKSEEGPSRSLLRDDVNHLLRQWVLRLAELSGGVSLIRLLLLSLLTLSVTVASVGVVATSTLSAVASTLSLLGAEASTEEAGLTTLLLLLIPRRLSVTTVGRRT